MHPGRNSCKPLIFFTILLMGMVVSASYAGKKITKVDLSKKRLISAEYNADTFVYSADFSYDTFFCLANFKQAYFDTTGLHGYHQHGKESDWDDKYFFHHSFFKNKADFSQTTFGKEGNFYSTRFDSATSFSNTRFLRKAQFGEAEFYRRANFDGMRCGDLGCTFFHAHFYREVSFNDADIARIDFEEAHFDSTIDMQRAKIGGCSFLKTSFNHSSFYGSGFDNALFFNATFAAWASFESTRYKAVAMFNESHFYNGVSFSRAHFDSMAFFVGTHFDSTVDFTSDTFKTQLNLSRIATKKGTQFDFSGCILPDTIDISNNQNLSTLLDFKTANFSDSTRIAPGTNQYRRHFINIYNTDISGFKIDYSHFRLYIPSHLYYDDQVTIYENLRQNFINNKQSADLEILDKEFAEFKFNHLNTVDRAFAILSKPSSVLAFTFLFLLFFTGVNMSLVEKLNKEVFTIAFFEQDFPHLADKKGWKKYKLLAFYSFIYTSIVYFAFRLDIGHIRFYNRRLLLWFAFIYSIGCINLFLVANLIFKV